jgi:hypothetical protein
MKKAILIAILCSIISISLGAVPSFQGLGDLPGGEYRSLSSGISADGSVIKAFVIFPLFQSWDILFCNPSTGFPVGASV